MVLYCVQHAGNIIRSIIHKFKYHPEEDAVFISDKDETYWPALEKIKYYKMPDVYEIADHCIDSQEEMKKYVDQVISGLLKETGLDPLDFSCIYAIQDAYNPFVLYFEMHSIKYMMIEDSLDSFADKTWDMPREFPEKVAYNKLAVNMHLQDAQGANCTKAFLYSYESKYPEKYKVPYEVFEYDEAVDKLDEKHRLQIVKGYDLEAYQFSTLLTFSSPDLTRHWLRSFEADIPLKYLRDDEFGGVYYFYKTIIDYCYRHIDFTLKLHPQSDEKFEEAFSEFRQLPRRLPAEAFLFRGKKFNILSPFYDAAVKAFHRNNYKVSFLGSGEKAIVEFFDRIHFVFLALTLISAIGKPASIRTFNISRDIISKFRDICCNSLDGTKFVKLNEENMADNGFIIADPTEDFTEHINGAATDSLIIAHGDCEASNIFARQKMTYRIIDESDGQEDVVQERNWTLLSKSGPLIDMVKEFSASYSLEHAKVRIESYPSD